MREDERNVAEQITTEKCSLSRFVSGYFPRFHKQVVRSGKQHIEREMVGRRRKLDEKRGVYGVIIQPHPKNLLRILHPSRLSFPPLWISSKIAEAHDEDAADFTGDRRSEHLISMRPVPPFLLPFLKASFCYSANAIKITIDWACRGIPFHKDEQKKSTVSQSFFLRMQMVPTPSSGCRAVVSLSSRC